MLLREVAMTEADARKLRVLWATDGSGPSHGAITLLRELVLPVTEQLTVLTVAPHSLLSGARPDPGFLTGVAAPARRRALLEAEHQARSEIALLDPEPVPAEAVSRWGNPIEEILRVARLSADLVILGAKGHSNLGLLLLGSVAQGVVQHATKPVLIARPGTEAVRKIVIGYDSSPAARRAVDFVGRLAVRPEVEFLLASVIEPFTIPAGTPVSYRRLAVEEAHRINERQHRTAERALTALANRFKAAGRQVQTAVLAGPAGPELDDFARKHEADLVVVGSRRPSPARHYLLGTTAEKLVRHSHTSVLVVR
jgi:nucleotide-binding universal stress UspA family protein